MFAIVSIAGFQQKVSEGQTLDVATLDAKEGTTVTFKDVLLVADGKNVTIGTPTISGATVTAQVTAHGRGDKVRVVKFRRRKRYTRTHGHRQGFTTVTIAKISA